MAETFHLQLKDFREASAITFKAALSGDYERAYLNQINVVGPKFELAHSTLIKLIEFQTVTAKNDYELAIWKLCFKPELWTACDRIIDISMIVGICPVTRYYSTIRKIEARCWRSFGRWFTSQITITNYDEIGSLTETIKTLQICSGSSLDEAQRTAAENFELELWSIYCGSYDCW